MNRTDPQFFRVLADAAARSTLSCFRNLENVDNKTQDGFDPVTFADQQAEADIRAEILSGFPDDSILGEELGVHRGCNRFNWILDPIDGTRSYISGIPLWGTLVGLLEDEKPIAGMMSQPYLGEFFFASPHHCFLERNQTRLKLRVSATRTLADAVLMTTAPNLFSGPEGELYDEVSRSVRMVRYGADCYAYCMLAAGQIDLVVEAGLNLYDVAALIPIIRHAGGVVTGWQGEPFGSSGRIVAAATPALHEEALAILSRA